MRRIGTGAEDEFIIKLLIVHDLFVSVEGFSNVATKPNRLFVIPQGLHRVLLQNLNGNVQIERASLAHDITECLNGVGLVVLVSWIVDQRDHTIDIKSIAALFQEFKGCEVVHPVEGVLVLLCVMVSPTEFLGGRAEVNHEDAVGLDQKILLHLPQILNTFTALRALPQQACPLTEFRCHVPIKTKRRSAAPGIVIHRFRANPVLSNDINQHLPLTAIVHWVGKEVLH